MAKLTATQRRKLAAAPSLAIFDAAATDGVIVAKAAPSAPPPQPAAKRAKASDAAPQIVTVRLSRPAEVVFPALLAQVSPSVCSSVSSVLYVATNLDMIDVPIPDYLPLPEQWQGDGRHGAVGRTYSLLTWETWCEIRQQVEALELAYTSTAPHLRTAEQTATMHTVATRYLAIDAVVSRRKLPRRV